MERPDFHAAGVRLEVLQRHLVDDQAALLGVGVRGVRGGGFHGVRIRSELNGRVRRRVGDRLHHFRLRLLLDFRLRLSVKET